MSDTLVAPQGSFELSRYPVRKRENLRAWDAADEFLLHHLDEAGVANAAEYRGSALIVNDGHGALTSALAFLRPRRLSDSYLSNQAMAHNLEINGIDAAALPAVELFDPQPEQVRLLVMKIPRSGDQLIDQLHRLRPVVGPDTLVVAGCMAKHMHTSTLEAFEAVFGPTTTTRARKKARLAIVDVDSALTAPSHDWPRSNVVQPSGLRIWAHAGVFAAGRLDQGSALMVEHLATSELIPPAATIVDLGCGDGVLTAHVAQRHAEDLEANDDIERRIVAIDESARAVASARLTIDSLELPAAGAVEVFLGGGIFDTAEPTGVEPDGVDLVVTNPPFHQNNAISDSVAWEMFSDAHRALRPGGTLLVVGNRHLKYHLKLHRIFGNSATLSSHPKFVVLSATKA